MVYFCPPNVSNGLETAVVQSCRKRLWTSEMSKEFTREDVALKKNNISKWKIFGANLLAVIVQNYPPHLQYI